MGELIGCPPMLGVVRVSLHPAGQAWALMHRFVEAHNRRGELAALLATSGGRPIIQIVLDPGDDSTSIRSAGRRERDGPP